MSNCKACKIGASSILWGEFDWTIWNIFLEELAFDLGLERAAAFFKLLIMEIFRNVQKNRKVKLTPMFLSSQFQELSVYDRYYFIHTTLSSFHPPEFFQANSQHLIIVYVNISVYL